MLMAMIENIYETMNLRITETAFELHLRKIYPTRNILSMRETETIAGQECLDVQKKTDGSVNIIGEVATDPVASWMIQSAQVASKFTLFTHHAKTFPNLVTALRNSMLRAGVFTDEKTAEEQVVQVLNFDIHLVKDFRGRRYIERVTECIPIEEKNEYTYDYRKEKGLENKLWEAADKLRGAVPVSDYKFIILGLIFLKYISDAFKEKYQGKDFLAQHNEDGSYDVWVREVDTKDLADDVKKKSTTADLLEEANKFMEEQKENIPIENVLEKDEEEYAR